MRVPPFLVMFVLIIASGCAEPKMPPTDKEMIQHFNNKRSAFEDIHEIISLCPSNSYYPPYHAEDTLCLKGISPSVQKHLDSLLVEIKCERIFYHRRPFWPDVEDTEDVSIRIPFFTSGYSIGGGTTKDFVYSTEIEDHYTMTIDSIELNDIYRKEYNDTILFKPISGNWYIQLTHD